MSNDRERVIRDDEIDLVELMARLWRHRLLVLVTTLLVGAIAVAYSMLVTPIYEAKVFVQPPTQNDIAHFNYGRGGSSGLIMLSVKDISDVYSRALQSESLRREFFESNYLPWSAQREGARSLDDLYNQMSKVLVLELVNPDSPGRYSIAVKLSDPHLAAQWAMRYVQMAGERAKSEVLKDVKADAMVKANNLERQIALARETGVHKREDRIAQLKEALVIAKSIGLVRPPIISGDIAKELSANMDGALTYMRGSEALEAEISNLERRSSDDPFIFKLREQQADFEFYQSLTVDPATVEVYRQDGGVESPDMPVNPKKALIILLGVLVGLFLGAILALLKDVWLSNHGVRSWMKGA
ncbi:Wzz/FepE/Etk N-terminal domain-containing protein [Pseudomonas palmensis]